MTLRPIHELAGRSVAFTVYSDEGPQPAGSKSTGRTKQGRVYVYDDVGRKGKRWRKAVADEGRHAMAGAAPFEGPLVVAFTFYVARPATVGRDYPTVRPDVLKLARGAEDALTKIVWSDDAQIVGEHLAKLYGDARLEVVVTELRG